jgi:hypothetical protein
LPANATANERNRFDNLPDEDTKLGYLAYREENPMNRIGVRIFQWGWDKLSTEERHTYIDRVRNEAEPENQGAAEHEAEHEADLAALAQHALLEMQPDGDNIEEGGLAEADEDVDGGEQVIQDGEAQAEGDNVEGVEDEVVPADADADIGGIGKGNADEHQNAAPAAPKLKLLMKLGPQEDSQRPTTAGKKLPEAKRSPGGEPSADELERVREDLTVDAKGGEPPPKSTLDEGEEYTDWLQDWAWCRCLYDSATISYGTRSRADLYAAIDYNQNIWRVS